MQQTFATPKDDKSNPYSTVNAAPKGQFCKPYSPQELSNGTMRLDMLKAQAGLTIVGLKFGREVEALWRQYLAGGSKKRIDISKSNYPGIYKSFAEAYVNNLFAEALINNILVNLRTGSIPRKSGIFDLKGVISAEELQIFLEILRFPFNTGAAGNLAGNFTSGSDFGKDTRAVTGKVAIKFLTDQSVRVSLDLQVQVQDAVDLCPGQPGDRQEQYLTIPLSRLEKSGFAGDVAFGVTYPVKMTKLAKL